MTSLGERLWDSLAETKAGDADIAREVGVNRQTVARWRKARCVAKAVHHEAQIAAALRALTSLGTADAERRLYGDLRQAMSSAAALLRRVDTFTPDDVLAVVVSKLSRADPALRLTIAPAFRGMVSRDQSRPLHYLVGVDVGIDGPPTLESRLDVEDVLDLIRKHLGDVWRDLGIHLRTSNAHEWPDNAQPALILQVPVVERPRPSPSRAPIKPIGMGERLLVVAPVYGYGELLAALLSEALGYGLVDLRYEEELPERVHSPGGRVSKSLQRASLRSRAIRARRLLSEGPDFTVWCASGEDLLNDLHGDIARGHRMTSVIAIGHGRRWAEMGKVVHQVGVNSQLKSSRRAAAIARQGPRDTLSIIVDYAGSDVVRGPNDVRADIDKIADATVLTAIEILDLLRVDSSEWRDGWLAHLRDARRLPSLRDRIATRDSRLTVPFERREPPRVRTGAHIDGSPAHRSRTRRRSEGESQ